MRFFTILSTALFVAFVAATPANEDMAKRQALDDGCQTEQASDCCYSCWDQYANDHTFDTGSCCSRCGCQ
ncbi:hypothetical protein ABZX51_010907 [Aspergillus tubingensis]|uniref:Uncharacterized protein n=1 Tax=Aspergillus tubingensis (strain CBS 134.48) TaxID=767770 RepID=A0A1L9MV18_ASPTC|nr:hypothetical protein ASPTUDRAFT_192831 [Aspergillus tubingensis CBS 134.48]